MNSNTDVRTNDCAQSITNRLSATAASFDRAAIQISQSMRLTTPGMGGKRPGGR